MGTPNLSTPSLRRELSFEMGRTGKGGEDSKRGLVDWWEVEAKDIEVPGEEAQAAQDAKMMWDGKKITIPVLIGWRRLALKVIRSNENIRLTQLLEMVTSRKAPAALDTTCTHPMYARYRGQNQWAKYVHCRMCKQRIVFERKPRDTLNRPATPAKQTAEEIPPYDPPVNQKKGVPKSKAKSKANASQWSSVLNSVEDFDEELEEESAASKIARALSNLNVTMGAMATAIQGQSVVLGHIQAGQQTIIGMAAASSASGSTTNPGMSIASRRPPTG